MQPSSGHHSDLVRAATLAHMVLSQSLSDEAIDELAAPTPPGRALHHSPSRLDRQPGSFP